MTSHSRLEAVTGSLLAVVVGLIGFVCLSLLRVKFQYLVSPGAFLGLLLTLLTYLLPGALVGLLAPRFRLAHGAVVGLLTVAVVWREIPLQRAALSAPESAQFLVLMALFGMAVTVAGTYAAGRLVALLRSGARLGQR